MIKIFVGIDLSGRYIKRNGVDVFVPRLMKVYAVDKEGRHVVKDKFVDRYGYITLKEKVGDEAEWALKYLEVKNDTVYPLPPILGTTKQRFEEGADMYEVLLDAQRNGRPYGVQKCTYPICIGRCVQICPTDAITMSPEEFKETGKIFPKIDDKKCIKCGLCIEACGFEAIYQKKEAIRETSR